VTQGDPGDAFYLLLEGAADVWIDGTLVATLAPGDWFGEIALLHNVPRTATVTTTIASELWSLDRDAFLATLGNGAATGGAADAAPGTGAGLIV
jgi:CRP-like cAMP-binding protein